MVSHVRSCRDLPHCKRSISVTTLISYLFAVMPLQGFCDSCLTGIHAQDSFNLENLDLLLLKFDEIKQLLSSSENRNLEGLKSIQSLLDEINSTYNMAISFNDLCEITKTQLSGMNINENIRPLLNQVIHNLQTTNSALGQVITETIVESFPAEHMLHSQHFGIFGYGIYAPWEWNWFGLNKKHEDKKQTKFTSRQVTYPGPIPKDDGSIPDDLIICGIEALVIGLLLIIPSGYTQALAIAIAYDMGTRGLDGLKQMSDMNKEKQKGPR